MIRVRAVILQPFVPISQRTRTQKVTEHSAIRVTKKYLQKQSQLCSFEWIFNYTTTLHGTLKRTFFFRSCCPSLRYLVPILPFHSSSYRQNCTPTLSTVWIISLNFSECVHCVYAARMLLTRRSDDALCTLHKILIHATVFFSSPTWTRGYLHDFFVTLYKIKLNSPTRTVQHAFAAFTILFEKRFYGHFSMDASAH